MLYFRSGVLVVAFAGLSTCALSQDMWQLTLYRDSAEFWVHLAGSFLTEEECIEQGYWWGENLPISHFSCSLNCRIGDGGILFICEEVGDHGHAPR